MKRTVSLIFALLLFVSCCPLTGCSLIRDKNYLVVYNWEEYIDEDIVAEFEEWYRDNGHPDFAGVRYETFDTNETFLTKVTKGREAWDVACPSDYMIGKMAAKGMLAPVDPEIVTNYENLSPYMREKFQESVASVTPEPGVIIDPSEVYGVGYMWGTMGILYNVEDAMGNVPGAPGYNSGTFAPIDSWKVMWDSYYDKKVYIKNSMREAFVIGALYAYADELTAAQASMSEEAFSEYLFQVLNDVSDESVPKIERALKEQQSLVNVKYDVDYDKIAMAGHSASLDFCWSGDGNLAIAMGAEQGNALDYVIPEEGSNVFFDGWVVNKDSRNSEAAQAFLNFMCEPESGIRNSEYIGYVSCVATHEVLEWAQNNWIDVTEGNEEEEIPASHAHMKDTASTVEDVRLFFPEAEIQQMLADTGLSEEDIRVNPVQYPSKDIFHKLAIMKTYTDAENDRVLTMWSSVKGGDVPVGLMVVIGVILGGVIMLAIVALVHRIVRERAEFKRHHFERDYPRF